MILDDAAGVLESAPVPALLRVTSVTCAGRQGTRTYTGIRVIPVMNLHERIASIVGYGRELAGSGLQGASKGRAAFLNGGPISPFLADVNKKALKLATLGACIGVLGGYLGRKHQPAVRTVAYGALGGALGFAAGFAWSSHTFAESVARGAMTNVAATRDQHWLKGHPIDYA